MLARITELTRRIRGLLRDLWKETPPPPLTPKEIEDVRAVILGSVGRHLYMIHRLEADLSCLVLACREYIAAQDQMTGDTDYPRIWERRDKALAIIQTYLDAWEGEE